MGIFDRLFNKNKQHEESNAPNVTFTIRIEESPPPAYDTFSSEIEGVPIRAEVPIEAKIKCDELLLKPNTTSDEDEYLHDNYWVNVYYKGVRHSYHGVNDLWTYSARDLPELPLIHEWIYSILGKKKAAIDGDFTTETPRDEKGTIYVYGTCNSLNVHLSFKPRGHVLSFVISDESRCNDKASYNTKTGQSDFPFYYSTAQEKIIAWARAVFEEKRSPGKRHQRENNQNKKKGNGF